MNSDIEQLDSFLYEERRQLQWFITRYTLYALDEAAKTKYVITRGRFGRGYTLRATTELQNFTTKKEAQRWVMERKG